MFVVSIHKSVQANRAIYDSVVSRIGVDGNPYAGEYPFTVHNRSCNKFVLLEFGLRTGPGEPWLAGATMSNAFHFLIRCTTVIRLLLRRQSLVKVRWHYDIGKCILWRDRGRHRQCCCLGVGTLATSACLSVSINPPRAIQHLIHLFSRN